MQVFGPCCFIKGVSYPSFYIKRFRGFLSFLPIFNIKIIILKGFLSPGEELKIWTRNTGVAFTYNCCVYNLNKCSSINGIFFSTGRVSYKFTRGKVNGIPENCNDFSSAGINQAY